MKNFDFCGMRHAATDCGHGEVPIFDGDSKRIPVNLRIRYAHAICGFYSGEIRSNSSASFDGLVRSRVIPIPQKNERADVVNQGHVSRGVDSGNFNRFSYFCLRTLKPKLHL